MKTRSIAQKFGMWLVLVTFFVMIVFGVINYFLFINQLDKDLNVRLDASTSRVADRLALHVWNLDTSKIQDIAQDQAFLESFAQLRVSDSFGDLIYETKQSAEEGEPLFIKKDIVYEGNIAGSIEAAYSTANIEIAKGAVVQSTLVIIFVVTLTVLVLAFFIARSISTPIKKLTETVQNIAKGDLSKRVPVTSQDEVGILGKTFNFMIEKLERIDHVKSEFISLASHQLRTPLTSMRIFLEMLSSEETRSQLSVSQKEYINNLQKLTQRMIKLVNDLLNVSRLEASQVNVETKATDMEVFIRDYLEEVKPIALSKKCHIAFTRPEKQLSKIPVDTSLLRQVLEILLTNAIQYNSIACDPITVLLTETGNEYLISIKDHGIGIPKEVQGRVFEKFFRAANAIRIETDRSGLGLYVAKMIMDAAGGRIWFESMEEKGSTFYVAIPKEGMKEKDGTKALVNNA